MTTTKDSGIIWAAYLRLSRLKASKRTPARMQGRYRNPDESVERQLRLIRAYCDEHGLNLPDELIFRDNGRSGWQKPGGPPPYRPDWDLMIKAGKNGEFGGVLVWKVSRFARNVRDGEDLLDLQLVVTGPDSGRIDLTTPSGRSNFRKQVEAATYESDEISSRVRTTFEDMRATGYRIGGRRAFGFEVLSQVELPFDAYEEDDEGRLIGPAAVYRQDEAEIIREAARRHLDGEALADLVEEFRERGIVTPRGGTWTSRAFTKMLANPLNGGHLSYKGSVIGTLAGVDPILDIDTYEALQAKLDARRRGRNITGRHWMTGALLCGNPDCPRNAAGSKRPPTMAGSVKKGRETRLYVCAKPGSVPGCGQVINAEAVEERARDAMLAVMKNSTALEAVRAAAAALDDQRAELSSRLEDLDADMAETEAKLADTPRSMTRRREQLNRNLATQTVRYEETQRQLAELGSSADHEDIPDMAPLTVEEWEEDTPAEEKAALLRRHKVRVQILPKDPNWPARHGVDQRRIRVTGPDGCTLLLSLLISLRNVDGPPPGAGLHGHRRSRRARSARTTGDSRDLP